MNKETVTNLFNTTKAFVTKRSPEILTGIGIAGMMTTTVLAVKATPKALRLIEEAEHAKYNEHHDNDGGFTIGSEELTVVETVKAAWKPYVPAAITCVASTACLVGASSVHARRNAALATAYQLSTTALSEYKAKVVETIGEKKERVVHDKIAEDKVKENPVSQTKEVIFTGKGQTLCMDGLSKRYFRSDKDKIMRAMNELNYSMSAGSEMYISLNEFYDEIGLPPIPLGEDLGWCVGKNGLIDIHFGATLTEDDEPCLVLEYCTPPEYGYSKLY